ncbi:thiol-disulfide oxidoreductase DCC family protein [Nocardia sp. NPDC059240]|uniref:thiol-disulfide oxidoreductase DCC family protein n=1 Tax=Nocardia sp. NPDC059240 TaxID=3346786 RepID=UPI0036A1F420
MTGSVGFTGTTGRPLVVFDGDCAFCTASVERIRERIRPEVEFVAWQRLDLAALGLTEQQVESAVQWIDGDGGRAAGARAGALLLRRAALPWRVVGTVMLIPPVSWVAAGVYRLVAKNRHRLPGGTAACAFPGPKQG